MRRARRGELVRTTFREADLIGARLLATSSQAFFVLVAGAGIGFAVQLGTVRLIGAESFGIFAYVIAWTTVLGYISTLGFHVSLLRLLPTYQVGQDWSKAGGVVRFAFSGAVISGTAIAVVAAGAVLQVYGAGSELGRALLIGAAVVPLLALRLVGAAAVRAFGGIIASMLPERILRDSLALAFLAVAALGFSATPDAVTATGAVFAAGLVTLWFVRGFLFARRPSELVTASRSYLPRDWLRPALPLTVIMLADTLMSRAGVLVLGARGETADVGIFAVAFSLALLAALPRLSVSALFAPTVSTLHARGDATGLQDLLGRSAGLSLLGTLGVALPLILGAPYLLPLFGPEFTAAAPVLDVLIIGQIVAAAAGPQQHLLTMTGHERQGAALMVTAAAGNVVGAALLCIPFGMMGVAAASCLSMVAWNVAMMWFVGRRLGLRPGLARSPDLLGRTFGSAGGAASELPPTREGRA